jgi:hypothetical protein
MTVRTTTFVRTTITGVTASRPFAPPRPFFFPCHFLSTTNSFRSTMTVRTTTSVRTTIAGVTASRPFAPPRRPSSSPSC